MPRLGLVHSGAAAECARSFASLISSCNIRIDFQPATARALEKAAPNCAHIRTYCNRKQRPNRFASRMKPQASSIGRPRQTTPGSLKCCIRNGCQASENRPSRSWPKAPRGCEKDEAGTSSPLQGAKTKASSMSADADEDDDTDHQTHPIATAPPLNRPESRVESLRPAFRHRTRASSAIIMSASVLLLAGLVVTCCALAASELVDQQARPANSEAHEPETNFHLSSAKLDSRPREAHEQSRQDVQASRLEEDEVVGGERPGHSSADTSAAGQEAGVAEGPASRRMRRARQRAGPQKPAAAKEAHSASGSRQAPQSREDWQQALATVSAPGGRLAAVSIKNVTAQNGQSVTLHCFVDPNEMGETGAISWFRGANELQLLTSDEITMVEDRRMVVRHGLSRENDWALQLSELSRADGGLYQCQTSDEQSPQLQAYFLTVVEPQASIVGAPDLAVKLGAPINLTCVIAQSADELQFVFWYRDSRMINYDLERERRGKIVLTKVGPRQEVVASQLQIQSAQLADSANFTCAPSGAKSTSVQLHVLEAADKRLIMFQNDDNHQRELHAVSSQQTNSALSSHLIRLSRGRAQALLLALFILASWFHLVAQLQTCISLALLAVIGFLLSHSSERRSRATRSKSAGSADASAEAERKLALLEEQQTSERRRRPSSGEQQGEEHESGRRGDSLEEDPLISDANTALHLLRSLTRDSAHSQCSASESIELDTSAEPKQSSIQSAHLEQLDKLHVAQRRALSQAQSSPGGSSSSSTGYNSDSRPAASVNLLEEKRSARDDRDRSLHELDDELEMIELLRNEPSAMRLIMEQLRAHKINQQPEGRPASKQLDCSRSAATFGSDCGPPAADEQSRSLGRRPCPNKAERRFFAPGLVAVSTSEPQVEPIYSIPARASGPPQQSAAPSGDLGRNEELPQSPPSPDAKT